MKHFITKPFIINSQYHSDIYHNHLIIFIVFLFSGCASLEWPVNTESHRVGQNYGSYQRGFHDGIDIVVDGPAASGGHPAGPGKVQGVVDGLRLVNAIFETNPGMFQNNPNRREISVSFQKNSDLAFCTYVHIVELNYDDPFYVNLIRHKRVRNGGIIQEDDIFIRSALGAGHPLHEITIQNLSPDTDDEIVYDNSNPPKPIAIQVGPNGWAETIPGPTDEYVGNYYFKDGGGPEYNSSQGTTDEYINDPENIEPDARGPVTVNKGDSFGRLSELWSLNDPQDQLLQYNYRHLHFIVSSAESIANPGTELNPLHSGDAIGFSSGYDPQSKPPRVGPYLLRKVLLKSILALAIHHTYKAKWHFR